MAIDRGGLRYTIEVRDQFSRTLARFRREIDSIRRGLNGLRASQAQLNATRRSANAAQASANRAQIARIRAIQAGVKQQQEVEALRARILRAQRAEARREARQDIALFRRRKQEEAAAARARATALRRQIASQKAANRAVRQGSRDFRQLRRSALLGEGAVNRVAFSFRRLIGIFAVFQAARAGASLFTGLIRDSLQFNQTIEDSQISLAALFSAVGRVRNVQKEVVEGAEAFGLAQAEAARQTRLLQADAISTTATFQELLRAFQAGVGPGLEADLKLDEIREITVRVSQAAAALTVPQNQLIEEIRSLIRGTIQQRTTIVASVVGITPKNIRDAKEAGNLFEFIRSRLDGFRFAALATQRSFTGLLARVRDSLQIAGGAASTQFFDQLKVTFEELAGAIIRLERDSKGKIERVLPQEDAVRAAVALFSRLSDALTIFREGLQQLTLTQFGQILGAIGELARVLSAAAVGFIQGLVQSIDFLVRGISTVAAAFGGGDGLIGNVEQFGRLLGLATGPLLALIAASGTLRVIWFFLAPLVSAFRAALLVTATTAQGLLRVVALLPGLFFRVLGLVGLIAVAAEAFAEAFLGAKGSIIDVGELIGTAIEQTITNTIGLAGKVTDIVTAAIQKAFLTVATEAGIALRKLRAFLDFNFRGSEDLARAKANELALENAKDRVRLEEQFAAINRRITESKRRQAQIEKDAAKRAAERFQALREEVNLRDEDPFIKRLQDAFGAIQDLSGIDFDAIGKKFADGLVDQDAITKQLNDAVRAFIEGREGPTEAEFRESPLSKFFNQTIANFQNGLSLIRPIVSQFASFVSDTIVDAFDPTTKTDLRERFAKFLQDIAKLIIRTLVQVAIARAVLGLFGSPVGAAAGAAGGGAASGLAFAEGGEIPDGQHVPKRARPRGMDSRDNTPIWAQPGEFMMRLDAVRRYGLETMEAINKGLIHPQALQALLGNRSKRHIAGMSPRGPRGYAEGGVITRATDGALSSGTSTSTPAQPAPAFIVSNDQTLDKLLSGGEGAFKRFLRDNAQEIDGILRSGRTGG